MARMRSIKPGFFSNERLSDLDPIVRLLFAGLWTIADREGRLEDRIKRIKVQVLPYDDCNVEESLQKLHDFGFIQRYSVGDCKYIQILAWKKHQHPHINEADSTIQAPCSNGSSTIQAPSEHRIAPSEYGVQSIGVRSTDIPEPSAPVVVKTPKFLLPEWVPVEPWEGYLGMRVKMRKPMTDRAKALAVKKIDALRAKGYSPAALLDEATEKCWMSIYEPKSGGASSPQSTGFEGVV